MNITTAIEIIDILDPPTQTYAIRNSTTSQPQHRLQDIALRLITTQTWGHFSPSNESKFFAAMHM